MIKKLAVLLLFVFLAGFAYHTTYTIHEKYSLPFHSDEWDHLALSLHLAKEGSISSIRAYNPFTGQPYHLVNRESGYHLLNGLLYLMVGMEVTAFAITLPTIVAFILAVNTLAFVKYATRSWVAATIAAVFSLTLKSNVTVLGPWFLVPSSLGIAMAPLTLYVLARAFNHKRQFNGFDLPLLLLVFTTLLIHPPSATVFIPITAVYLAYNWRLALAKKTKIAVLATAGVAATAAFMLVTGVPLNLLLSPLNFAGKYLYFGAEDYAIKALYSYHTFLGRTVILLAGAGVYHTIHSNERRERIIPLTVLALLPLVLQFYRTNHLWFSTYRRVFVFTGEMILILAAVGLYYLYKVGVDLVRKATHNWVFTGIARVALLIVVASIVLSQVDSTFKYKERLYHVIEESDVAPIKWMADNTPEGSVVVARSHISKAITPLSGRLVVGTGKTMMRVSPARFGDTNHFFQPSCNCACKKARIDKYGIDYVYTRNSFNCPFTKLAYSQNGKIIYEVVGGDLSSKSNKVL